MSDVIDRHIARLATPRKLYSRKGTLIGTVTYPLFWDERIFGDERGTRLHVVDGRDILRYDSARKDLPLEIKTFVVVPSQHERGAVEIHGIDLETFEKQPGCSFQPGAGYLRSLVT